MSYGVIMSKDNKEYNREHENSSDRVEEPFVTWELPYAASKITDGLTTTILKTIQERLGISNTDLSEILMISPRTLDRRKKEAVLPADESERSFRVARLTEIAADVLGSMEKASSWFKAPNFSLGNEKPINLIKTEPGARIVERTLRQIEHGITV